MSHQNNLGKIVISIFLILIASCFNDNDDETPLEIIWETTISPEFQAVGLFFPRKTYNNGVLTIGFDDNEDIRMLDINSGKELWRLGGFSTFEADIKESYLRKNFIILAMNKVYGINLDNGEQEYIISAFSNNNRRVRGIDDTYYFSDNFGMYKGNVFTAELELVLSIPDDQNPETEAHTQTPHIIDKNGIRYLLFYSNLYFQAPVDSGIIYVNLYNETDQKYEYQTIFSQGYFWSSDSSTHPASIPEHLIVDESKAFAYFNIASKVFKFNIMTGEISWMRNFPSGFTFSGLLLAENKLLANCEDTRLYAVNLDNGNVIWQTDGGGTSTPMFYMNGVVYFSGGGDGLLHAVRVSDGKHLAKMRAPQKKDGGRHLFVSRVGGINDRIFVSTLSTAYCLRAF